MGDQTNPDTMRWIRRASVLAVLLIGWIFILVTNHFRITPPVVFVCLGYFAGVCAIYTLFRTGATAVTETTEADDATSWSKPLGALDELEREKRALLKAIKEAEFDQQMGKLSKADAEHMIGIYRARAIEVIKEIEVQEAAGEVGSVRDRILREARARIEVEAKSKDAVAVKKKKAKGDGAKREVEVETKTYEAPPDATLGDVLEGKLREVKSEVRTVSVPDDEPAANEADDSAEVPVEAKPDTATKEASR